MSNGDDLFDFIVDAEARKRSTTLQAAEEAGFSLQRQQELEDAMLETYGIDVSLLSPDTPKEVRSRLFRLSEELIDPLREWETVVPPQMSPIAGMHGVMSKEVTEEDVMKAEIDKIIRQYQKTAGESLERRGIDIGGAGLQVEKDLAHLPPSADPTRAVRQSILYTLNEQGIDINEGDINVFRDPATKELIWNYKLPDGGYSDAATVKTLGKSKWEGFRDWWKIHGKELGAIVGGGITTAVVFGKPLLGGVTGDALGMFVYETVNLIDLRDRGLLDAEDWTDDEIYKEAAREGAKMGAFSLGSAAIFRAATPFIKRLWKADFNEDQMYNAIKKGLQEETKGVDPGDLGFWDKKSALSFIKRKIEADDIPGDLKEAFPGFPEKIVWSDKYWNMGREEAMELAKLMVAKETGDYSIMLNKTLPQLIERVKPYLSKEEIAGIGSMEDLQLALVGIAGAGGAMARQIDEVLLPQQKYVAEEYGKKLGQWGFDINKIRTELGGIAKLMFGKEFQQDVLDPINKNLSKETEAFNVLKESLGEAFELWTLGAQTAKEAGAALREEVLVPIYTAAKAIKDQGYVQLAQRAGGGNKMYDPRSLMEEVTKWQAKEGKEWVSGTTGQEFNRILTKLLGRPLVKTGPRKGEPKLVSYSEIKKLLELTRSGYSDAAGATGSADRAAFKKLRDLVENFRYRAFATVDEDIALTARTLEDDFGVFKDTFEAGIISRIRKTTDKAGTRFSVKDANVLKNLLFTGSKMDDQIIREVLFNKNNPASRKSQDIVQGFIKAELANLGRTELGAASTGGFNIMNISPVNLAAFRSQYEPLINEFFPKGAAEKLFSRKGLFALRTELKENEKLINRLKDDQELLQMGINVDRQGTASLLAPETLFDKLWHFKGTVPSITATKTFLKKIPKGAAGNRLRNQFKNFIAQNLDEAITVPGTNVIDPLKLKAYIKPSKYGDSLDIVFGKEFKEGLDAYADMINYFMPQYTGAAGETTAFNMIQKRTMGKRMVNLQTASGLTRAYIGIFTRPGRFLTAIINQYTRAGQKRAVELMLYPNKFQSRYEMTKFLESPIVHTLIRNWLRPAAQEEVEEKVGEVTEQVTARPFFQRFEVFQDENIQDKNTGGRISPSLMPLRYGL